MPEEQVQWIKAKCANYERDNQEEQFKDKALRYDDNKIRHDLLPAWALNELAKIYTMGAKKYAPNNWRRGMKWSRVLGSLKRHLNKMELGEDLDEESGLHHMAHVAWNAITLLEYYKIYPQGDDRNHDYLTRPKIGLDIDEVLCNFVKGWHEKWGEDINPDKWNYDREMSKRFKIMKENNELDNFYLNLEPRISPKDIPFEPTCYVTSRPVSTEITEKWLKKHGFPEVPVYTVAVGQSKVEVMKSAKIDIFIDDRFENFVDLNNNGICCFLWDAAHNQRYNVGYKRIKSFKELV